LRNADGDLRVLSGHGDRHARRLAAR